MKDEQKSEVEARLDAVRAKRAAIEAAKASRAEEDLLAQVESEELDLKNAEAIAAAEAEHGPVGKKIAVVETDLGVVILKRAHALVFRRFQDEAKFTHAQIDKLIRPCVVYPRGDALDRILDELPATALRLANAIARLAGQRAEDVAGK